MVFTSDKRHGFRAADRLWEAVFASYNVTYLINHAMQQTLQYVSRNGENDESN